jgi:hypothetical protein
MVMQNGGELSKMLEKQTTKWTKINIYQNQIMKPKNQKEVEK